MHTKFETQMKLESYDEELGVIVGYALISSINGERYFYDLQNTHYTESSIVKAVLKATRSGMTPSFHEHNSYKHAGHIAFMMPVTSSMSGAMGMTFDKTGLIVGIEATPEAIKKYKNGEYVGLSFGLWYDKTTTTYEEDLTTGSVMSIIENFELHEVSLTSDPLAPEAKISVYMSKAANTNPKKENHMTDEVHDEPLAIIAEDVTPKESFVKVSEKDFNEMKEAISASAKMIAELNLKQEKQEIVKIVQEELPTMQGNTEVLADVLASASSDKSKKEIIEMFRTVENLKQSFSEQKSAAPIMETKTQEVEVDVDAMSAMQAREHFNQIAMQASREKNISLSKAMSDIISNNKDAKAIYAKASRKI